MYNTYNTYKMYSRYNKYNMHNIYSMYNRYNRYTNYKRYNLHNAYIVNRFSASNYRCIMKFWSSEELLEMAGRSPRKGSVDGKAVGERPLKYCDWVDWPRSNVERQWWMYSADNIDFFDERKRHEARRSRSYQEYMDIDVAQTLVYNKLAIYS